MKALELNPGFEVAHWVLGRAYEAKSMFPEAIAEIRESGAKASLAYVYALSGDKSEARRILHELERAARTHHIGHVGLALIRVGIGNSVQRWRNWRKPMRQASRLIKSTSIAGSILCARTHASSRCSTVMAFRHEFAREAIFQHTVFPAKCRIDHQPDNQPRKKSQPRFER